MKSSLDVLRIALDRAFDLSLQPVIHRRQYALACAAWFRNASFLAHNDLCCKELRKQMRRFAIQAR